MLTAGRPCGAQAAAEAWLSPSMISARHLAPLQSVPFGIQRLPPNQGAFRLLEVQPMPIGRPSASLSTLLYHAKRDFGLGNGASARKPMNCDGSATRS